MSFMRTKSGIENQYKFHRVDFVVYIEGRSSECLSDDGKEKYIDELFWETLFVKVCSNRTFLFKPLGSKTAVLPYANLVRDGQANNVIVCLDADYDRINATYICHHRVLYSRGYSIENDLVEISGVSKAAAVIVRADVGESTIAELIDTQFKEIERIGRLIGDVDVSCQAVGLPIQNKKSVGELVESRKCAFCRIRILKKIKIIKKKRSSRISSISDFSFFRDYCGKVIVYMAYNACFAGAKHFGRVGNMSRETFEHLLLRHFVQSVSDGEFKNITYYQEVVLAATR